MCEIGPAHFNYREKKLFKVCAALRRWIFFIPFGSQDIPKIDKPFRFISHKLVENFMLCAVNIFTEISRIFQEMAKMKKEVSHFEICQIGKTLSSQ